MTPLRQRLIEEIELRGFSPHTKNCYVRWVADLARFRYASPDQITDEQVREYLLHLLHQRRLSPSSLIVAVSALRFFYGRVIGRPTEAIEKALPRMKKRVHRPQVYSSEELERLFSVKDLNRKHRAIFMTTYAAGLRVSEVCRLKIEHLLSDRGQIRVVQGKGGKDRYTLLSPRLLDELRTYWRLYRPKDWLFPSDFFPQRPLSIGTVERAFNHALEVAGLPRRGGIHTLRHTFATRLLEAGIDLVTLQRLLGHSQLSTTSTYLHVRRERIADINSAFDLIDFERARRSS
jgi:site-specific recombinase XerD